MKMIVTPTNIKYVASMLQKVAKDKKIVSQLFYPANKKESTILKSIGIEKFVITKSNKSVFQRHVKESVLYLLSCLTLIRF